MSRADVTDLYSLDELLTEDEVALRDAVARFVDEEFLPVAAKHFREGTFPTELIPKLAELRAFGGALQGYGCAGITNVAYGLLLQELERGDSGLRSFASVQSNLCMYPIYSFGDETQRRRWLPDMAQGKKIGCFALTEPGAGSDPGAMQTRARRDGQHWVIDGVKRWVTNGTIADLAIVWAKVEDGGAESIRGFIVERGKPGFEVKPMEGKLSLRASATAELTFNGVRVPSIGVLAGVEGLRGPLQCLNVARQGIAFGVMGAAVACFEAARARALERQSFGKPIAAYQLTQEKLADMLQEIVKGQLLALRLARIADDRGKASPEQVSLAKRNNVKAALDIARAARGIYGADGILDDSPPVRHMLNLESVSTYEGTHEVHTLVVGKAITGLSAFGG